ncbi:MAG: LL-diaminopimelate aminotransferase [Chlamydiota bacterium]|nr:LL-diaminopimelate aminotransferase [Chlamydiota bacterium]
MVIRNPHFERLPSHYLFVEIARRAERFRRDYPQLPLISLGIGDTVIPILPNISKAMASAAYRLSTNEGYRGYGSERGSESLRQAIAQEVYQGKIDVNSISISDGAKCDLHRLQSLIGVQSSIGVQDPAYPVYVDGSLLQGTKRILPLPCNKENNFFPDLEKAPHLDVLYLCSPNNPTGMVAPREQLEGLVRYAQDQQTLIIFDRAYSDFINDPLIPKSIYEIEGAEEVAIEVGSFSKQAGFTGIRLGWSVVPAQLHYPNGLPIQPDWFRLLSTTYNGPSYLAEQGGLAALDPCNKEGIQSTLALYRENGRLLRSLLQGTGYRVEGGEHAPYLCVEIPGKSSWEAFDQWLYKAGLLVTPGAPFGPSGEGYIRLSLFFTPDKREELENRLKGLLLDEKREG